MTDLDRKKLEALLSLPGETLSLFGDVCNWWAGIFWAAGEAVDAWLG